MAQLMRLGGMAVALAFVGATLRAQQAPAPGAIPAGQVVALLGLVVQAPDGKELGRVVDVLVDDAGRPQAAIIDVGGFLGVGNRKVAADWDALHFMLGKTPHVKLDVPAAQVTAAPDYDPAKPVVAIGAPRPAETPK